MNNASDSQKPVVHSSEEIPIARAAAPTISTELSATAQRIQSPLDKSARIAVIDALRGFALFGIILVNLPGFAYPIYDNLRWNHPWHGSVDDWADLLARIIGDGKFYALFSFLFGYGFALQVERFRARGASIVPTYLRRFGVLLMIGIAHAVLFWWGDILVLYATLGFVLLAVRNWSDRALLRTIAIIMFLFVLANAVSLSWTHGVGQFSKTPNLEAILATATANATAAYGEGSFLDSVKQRIADWIVMLLFVNTYIAPSVLCLFLLGLLAGRNGVLTDPRFTSRWWRRALLAGIGLGIPLNVLYAVATFQVRSEPEPLSMSLADLMANFSAPLLTLGYVAIFMLMRGTPWWRQCVETPLTSVGRMALTNYLLQSVVASLIFNGYGLGYFSGLPAIAIRLLAIGIFVLQIPFSALWLRYFEFGPVEWFWRAATYGKFPTLIRRAPGLT